MTKVGLVFAFFPISDFARLSLKVLLSDLGPEVVASV